MLAVLALLAGVVCLSTATERRFDKKLSVSPGGTLRIHTDVGTVRIAGSASNEVAVLAVINGRERDVNDFQLSAEPVSDGVEIRGDGAKMSSWWHVGTDLDVDISVTVPREYNVRVETSGGDVHIGGVQGRLDGETSGGDIRLRDITGPIKMTTSGGDIEAGRVNGDVSLETSGGDIRLSQITGRVNVTTSGGDITVGDVEGKVTAETSGGDITVTVRGENMGVSVETSGGDIEIVVAKNSGANIDASTSGGEVICDLPVTVSGKIEEGHVRGTVNGGGPVIHAETSGGDIRIKSLP
jgi:hypothetical protein